MTRRQSSKRFLHRLTASCLICTLSWGPPLASLANDITPDGATRTTIDRAQNGVRVVNIAPPTQGGVSHNKYTDFNVRQTGAIMNNSREVGVSQLGGALPANPHYSDRTAQIILNEVTSNNRSQLKGYTEIFGDRAEFILANPNGITCAGCGFINTSRLGLVTGTPQLDQLGRLDGLAIGQGDVLIEGLGLNAENVRYVDIVTRLAKIQGELIAGEELNIHTGNGRFDYKTRTISSDPNAAATGATFAVDASALGSMYAGRIKIISSEAGLGVRNDAKLVANVDDLIITAQGDIAYTDARAKRDIKLRAKGNITQTKVAQAGNDLRIIAGKTADLSGDSVNATATLDVRGDAIKLHGASKATPLNVAARTANLGGKQGVQLARTQFQTNETATLQSARGDIAFSQGTANANRLTITAARNITNEDHLLHAGQALTLRAIAGNIENRNAGSLWSKGTLSADAGNMVENKGLVRSTGDMKIVAGGALKNTGDAKQSGLMVTDAALTLEAGGALANRGGAITAQSAVVKAQSITFHHAEQTTQGGLIVGGDMTLTAKGALRNTGQIIKTDGNLSATAQSLANSNDGNIIGEMRATGTMDLGVTNDLANQGLIYAAGALDMTVGGAVTNTGDAKKTGLVLSKAALTLNANAALTNQGGVISAQSAVIEARSIQLRAIPGNTDVEGLLFGGDATLTTVDDLDNQGQQINAQGALSITARSLSNRNNGQMVGKLRSGQAMDIHISQGLTNEGYLYASKTLTAKAGGALINRGNGNDTGILLSDGALSIDADGALESRGGIIAAQSVVLNARSVLLDRTGQTTDRGGLSTKADASLVVTTGFTNNGQRVFAGRNLTIDAASIVNQSGAGQVGKLHATGRLSLTSGAGLTNRGRIEGAGVNLKTRATLTNIGDGKNSGVLAAGNALTLDITGNLDNRGILSSKGNSTITLSSDLLNAAHRISIGGDLRIKAATLDNSGGGEIEIGGNLTTVGQLASVDNRSGRIKGLTAGKILALNMRALRNEGGNIASNGSISLVIDADYDLKGAFSAGGTLAMQARRLRNYTRLDAGEMLRLTASGNFSNETGAVLASDRDIEIVANGSIVNKSEITSGRNLKLEAKGGNITNEAAAKVTGGLGTTTLIASNGVINRNKLSSGQDMALTAASLDNRGQVATGRDLAATVSGDLHNREGKLLFAGRDMTLNVGGALDNNRAELYSQGDMMLRGLSGGNSASIRNFVGTIEAGGNLTIRTNRLDNLAEVYDTDPGGEYGYNIVRVTKGGYGEGSYAIMEQDQANSTLRAHPSYLKAGSNLFIYNADIHNLSSVISAYGNLIVNGGRLDNETASVGEIRSLIRKWGKHSTYKERYCKRRILGICVKRGDRTKHKYETKEDTYTGYAYSREQAIFNAKGTVNVNGQSIRNGSVKSLDNPSHTTTYNTASLQQIQKTGQVDLTEFLTLPQGEHGLFRLNPTQREFVPSASLSLVLPGKSVISISPTKPRRAHRYLIESNVEFIDTTRFVGSEYFLDRMGVDLNESLRLMGDAVVETRLVERAILQVTKHTFLSGDVGSSAEQMTRLYDAALAEAERFEQEGMPLTVGVALSPEQVKSLRHDLIWLEEREVAGARVLAPQLYLSQATLAQIETGTGPVISGGDVLLASEEDFGNQGTITARRDVGISSEGSFTNTGSVDAGESLVVDVKEDIINRGPGSLYGGDLVALYAEGDIRNESTAEEIHLGEDIVSRMKDIASIESGGNLILDAGGDIVQKAAKLNAKGSAVLEAKGDISFETIALRNKSVNRGSNGYSIHDRTEHVGGEAVFGGDLVMKSGGDTTLTATRMEVGGGADITTGGSFDLLSAQNTYHSESYYEYDDGGWFGSSGSEDSVSDETRQVSSVLKVGKNLSLGSGRDINISASKVEVEGAASVTAAGNFNLLSKADTLSEASSKTHDGAFSESEEKHTKDTVDHVSTEFNVGGKLDVEAKQVNLVASTIKAREAEIEADLIQLVSEKDLDSETHFSDGSGVLLRKIKNKGHVKEEVVEAGIQVAEKLVVNGRTLVEEGLGKDNLLKNLSSQSDLDIAGVKLIKQVANNEEWDDEITSLSATGQLLVQAVVGYFTAGAGAGLVNAGNAAVQAGIDAAINSLIQQATTQMVEAALTGNPPKFDTKAMLMGAITSAASGVASHGMDSALGEGLVADVQKTALKSTGRAVVETAVYGGDFRDRLGDNLKTGMVDLAGEKLAGKIGDNKESLGAVGHKTAHAALGCAMGAASGGQCAGGAVGAVAAETVAELYGDSRLATGDVDQDNLDDFKAKTELVGELAAIGGAVLTDTDAESAVLTGTNAVENNYLSNEQKLLKKSELAGCDGLRCQAGVYLKYAGISGKQDIALLTGIAEGTGEQITDEMVELVKTFSNPQQMLDGLKAIVEDPSLLGDVAKSELDALKTELSTFEEEYQRAGWDGANKAGEALGHITGKVVVLVADVAVGTKGTSAVVKFSGKTLTKATRKVVGKLKAVKKVKGVPKSVGKGMNNPTVKSSAAKGREIHKKFAERVKQKPDWKSEKTIIGPNGEKLRPDALTPSGRPVELKPNTPSGRRQGAKQIKKYKEATGTNGRVIYYDP